MMKWFIQQEKKVHGPFDANEVSQLLAQGKSHGLFLWTRGMDEWIQAEKWTPNYTPQSMHHAAHQPKSAGLSSSSTAAITPLQQSLNTAVPHHENKPTSSSASSSVGQHLSQKLSHYKVQYDFIDQGSMTIDQLVEFTTRQQDVSKIAVYDPKDSEWKEIYALPEIVNRLGITRRKNARVPIMAQFSGQSSTSEAINSRVVTISVGGMGLSDNFNLTIGQTVFGQLTSPHFFSAIQLQAEVTYSGQDGYVGLKFTHLNDDALALITEYVNKFSQK